MEHGGIRPEFGGKLAIGRTAPGTRHGNVSETRQAETVAPKHVKRNPPNRPEASVQYDNARYAPRTEKV